MISLARLAVIAAAFFSVTSAAQATTYVCSPKAIADKNAYVVARFQDFLNHKYTNQGTFGPVLAKIWDGNGDCDTTGDAVGKLPPASQIQLMAMHYYGDVMSSMTLFPAKRYDEARTHMDDFLALHDVIMGPYKDGFPASFKAQDIDIFPQMKDVDKQLTKMGHKAKQ